jgi:hypothetical protein
MKRDEVNKILNSVHFPYHSSLYFLSSSIVFKNLNILIQA